MDGYEELSDSAKVEICADFILNGPPGQFSDVYNDVRALLDNDGLLKDTAPAAAKLHRDSFLPVQLPEDSNFPSMMAMVSKHGELGENWYYEPRTQRQFSFNAISRNVERIDAHMCPTDAETEACRQSLQAKVDEYLSQHYASATTSVYATQEGGNNTYTICIESHKYSLNNFWCGRWTSEWAVVVDATGKTADVRGIVKMRIHYFEDANIQLQSNKEHSESISFQDSQSLADKVGELLLNQENKYQDAVNDNYGVMAGTCFKSLRRALPVTKSKLEWGKIASYRVGEDMKQN
eukprot:CFRG4314T1